MAVPDYYNRVNPDLLGVIPPDARTVLEIGCGTGVMARDYRRINPSVRYLGVEMNPEAAAMAEEHINHVVVGDIAAVDPSELGLGEGSVDCLVFGDVLEHMVDPWAAIRKLAPLLRDGGQAVASIPNVQHWTMILNLFMSRWEYADEGLMDRTHLRFFTVEGMRKLFDEAGLKVFDMKPRIFPSQDFDRFLALMAPVAKNLGLDMNRFAVCVGALQFIVRSARVEAVPRKIAVQTLIAEPLVCARVRVIEPDQFLGTIPGIRTIASTNHQALGGVQVDESKIFVRQRNVLLEGPSLRSQAEMVRGGYLVIAEFDDDPLHFPEVMKNRFLTFTACHAVQTSTEALAEKIRPYNPHVKVIANQVASLPPPRPTRTSRPGHAVLRRPESRGGLGDDPATPQPCPVRLRQHGPHPRDLRSRVLRRPDDPIQGVRAVLPLSALSGDPADGRRRAAPAESFAVQPLQVGPEVHRVRAPTVRSPWRAPPSMNIQSGTARRVSSSGIRRNSRIGCEN